MFTEQMILVRLAETEQSGDKEKIMQSRTQASAGIIQITFNQAQRGIHLMLLVVVGGVALSGCSRTPPAPSAAELQQQEQQGRKAMIEKIRSDPKLSQQEKDAAIRSLEKAPAPQSAP